MSNNPLTLYIQPFTLLMSFIDAYSNYSKNNNKRNFWIVFRPFLQQ